MLLLIRITCSRCISALIGEFRNSAVSALQRSSQRKPGDLRELRRERLSVSQVQVRGATPALKKRIREIIPGSF